MEIESTGNPNAHNTRTKATGLYQITPIVVADYGAFIEVEEGVEGLIHVSEMSWSTHLR